MKYIVKKNLKYKIQIIPFCILGGCLLAFLWGRHEWRHIEIAPDSSGYHFLAVNILTGRGYYQGAAGQIDTYDAATRKLFDARNVVIGSPSMGRTPGYPLFLSLIYKIHGINPDAVIPYQIALAGVVGGEIVLLGAIMFEMPGALAGMIAVFLLGMNRYASYAVSQLLTECLAMFLLTSAAVAAAWAKKGRSKREISVGILTAFSILTRPGLVFVGLMYFIILFFQSWTSAKSRILAFMVPFAIIISAWSIFASFQAGRFVALSGNSSDVIYAGLDPEMAARRAGVTPPEINRKSLEAFWYTWGGGVNWGKDSLIKEISAVPGRLVKFLVLDNIKLKVATDWLPMILWDCILMGFALAGSTKFNMSNPQGKIDNLNILMKPGGPVRSFKSIKWVYFLAAGLLFLVILGFSTTLFQAFFWLSAIISPLIRLEFTSKSGMQKLGENIWPHWFLSWYWGFVLMTVVSFGLPRFMRPFLPVFYLSAAISIPLLLFVILGAFGGSIKMGREQDLTIVFERANR